MSRPGAAEPSPWAEAVLAAALFAIDPRGCGGVALRGLGGPVRDQWLALVRELLPAGTPFRRVPLHVTEGRLLGGLDLTATLRAGRPIAERGLLAEADGGVLVLAMAERLAPSSAAYLAAGLDTGELRLERDGLAERLPARIAVVALDEGIAEDERPPEALLDRLAFRLDLAAIGLQDLVDGLIGPEDVAAAGARLPGVRVDDPIVEALCGTALALGIGSMRAPLLALRVARAVAALAGRDLVSEADAAVAGRFVLAPRATALPASDEPVEDRPDEQPSEPEPSDGGETGAADRPPPDVVLAATQAAIPPGLLAQLRLAAARGARPRSSGRAGAPHQAARLGRPAGIRRGEPHSGARLNLIETLRAAAPWQPLRRRERLAAGAPASSAARVEVRRDDFRITRLKHRAQTAAIFVVDASGSAALHRLAEAKGAVELLLADCYVRRDRVALIAFRGRAAELLLPPTRSLVRAKRGLAGLPGGGGTPLAAGLDAAADLAEAVRRRGETPVVVLLTDGRANVTRDGIGGRTQAEADALVAARRLATTASSVLLVDTSPRPQPGARALAAAAGATYLPLPFADAAALSGAVREAARPSAARAAA